MSAKFYVTRVIIRTGNPGAVFAVWLPAMGKRLGWILSGLLTDYSDLGMVASPSGGVVIFKRHYGRHV